MNNNEQQSVNYIQPGTQKQKGRKLSPAMTE